MKSYKRYTDLKQSKKLAEILPLESADMYYDVDSYGVRTTPEVLIASVVRKKDIPCWSLAALLDIIKIDYKLEKSLLDQSDYFTYAVYDSDEPKFRTYEYDNPIDACVEMIMILKDKDLL